MNEKIKWYITKSWKDLHGDEISDEDLEFIMKNLVEQTKTEYPLIYHALELAIKDVG